jgi:hypothetical protein
MGTKRPNIPAHVRISIEEEALGFCAIPTCFKPPTQRHHIDGNKENNDPKNIIYICGSCHDLFHYRNEYLESDFHLYKQHLTDFTPGKKNSLEEIIATIDCYYEKGNFPILRDAVNILLKFHNKRMLDKTITAHLYKLIAEINIQTDRYWLVADPLTKARSIYHDLRDFDGLAHVNGLLAVSFIKYQDYETARHFLGIAKKQSEDKLSRIQGGVKLGWINSVLSDIAIKTNQQQNAYYHAEESLKFYEIAYDELCLREKADMHFQTAKVLVASDNRSQLIRAERFLDESKELLYESGWNAAIVNWHIAQFQRLRKLEEIEEAKKYLYLAWEYNKCCSMPPKTAELLRLIKRNLNFCCEQIVSDLYEKHKYCLRCNKSEVQSIIDCNLESIGELKFI